MNLMWKSIGVAALSWSATGCVLMNDNYYCSEVRGTVRNGDTVVVDVEVERHCEVSGGMITDRTRTDGSGRFAFDQRHQVEYFQWIGEPLLEQRIVIVSGERRTGWEFTKQNIERHGEIGRPLVLLCDLQNRESTHSFTRRTTDYSYYGLCSFLSELR